MRAGDPVRAGDPCEGGVTPVRLGDPCDGGDPVRAGLNVPVCLPVWLIFLFVLLVFNA